MPRVQFTPILKRFFPSLGPAQTQSLQVEALLEELEQQYPGLKDYLLDEQGELRQHVNIFVNDELVRDFRQRELSPQDEVFIMQALSGG
ncbi:MAG: MoaD/ThiS family protein [Bacteroidota bacterium]